MREWGRPEGWLHRPAAELGTPPVWWGFFFSYAAKARALDRGKNLDKDLQVLYIGVDKSDFDDETCSLRAEPDPGATHKVGAALPLCSSSEVLMEKEKEKDGPKPEETAPQEEAPERQDVIYDLTAESVSADEVKAILEGRTEAGAGPEVEELRRERDGYYDQYLRAMADLDNMRKRVARERTEYERYATENLLRRLLTVVDNFRRAIDVGRECREFGSFFEGIELISRQMLEILEREGVELFESTGEEFDPSRHDAIYTVETDDHPPDIVVEEIAPGYLMGERVLRPAQVVVSKAKQPESGPQERETPGDGPAHKAE